MCIRDSPYSHGYIDEPFVESESEQGVYIAYFEGTEGGGYPTTDIVAQIENPNIEYVEWWHGETLLHSGYVGEDDKNGNVGEVLKDFVVDKHYANLSLIHI